MMKKGVKSMQYIAHIRKSDNVIQSVETHLLEVKQLAETLGEKFGIKHVTGLAGMLHDLGKFSDDFRNYILEAIENPDAPPKRGSVDHSTAGGKLLFHLFHEKNIDKNKALVAEIVGNAIISHHSYLQDFLNANLESDYLRRVKDKELNNFDKSVQLFYKNVMNETEFINYVENAALELKQLLISKKVKSIENTIMFLSKIVFSSLIDADRTNTRQFEEQIDNEVFENSQELFKKYYEKLMAKLHSFKVEDTPINRLRREMSEQCEQFAQKPSGIYTMSIPTGGGKTLASLRYALKHALLFNKKRIIYVVPFTTIIEQNAEDVRKIIDDDYNLLEHHSNVVDEEIDRDDEAYLSSKQRLKLAKDNWDSPIIFTTMVQFLNVFYAKGSRYIRRLHNLSESTIIFDEVQKVPSACVSLFNDSLNFLKLYGKSSLILCTATQPALEFVDQKLLIDKDGEMVKSIDEVIGAFKRVDIVDRATTEFFNNEILTDFILNKIDEKNSILIILNTKSVVKDLYERLKVQGIDAALYHLSTSMCANHRKVLLDEMRENLKCGKRTICISTQLIEAGVDISFEMVVRSLAGLDSIAQAAGRCNRHGEMGIQQVYVIDHEEEDLTQLQEIKIGKRVSKRILIDLQRDKNSHGGDLLSRKAMESFFQQFYTELENDLNFFIPELKKNMTELLSDSRKNNSFLEAYKANKQKDIPLFILNSYKTAAEHFSVIKDLTTSVIVPYGEGKEIIADLNGSHSIEDLTALLKKAQRYSINLFEHEKQALSKNGGLVSYLEGNILALKEGAYNMEYGLDVKNEGGLSEELFF